MASTTPSEEGASKESDIPPAKRARVEEAPFSLLSSLPKGLVQRHVLPFLGYNTLMRSVLRVNTQLRDMAVDRLVQDIAVEKSDKLTVCLDSSEDENCQDGDVKELIVEITIGAGHNECYCSREALLDCAMDECETLAEQQTQDMGGFEEEGGDGEEMTLNKAMARRALEETGEVMATSGYGFAVQCSTQELTVLNPPKQYSIKNMPVKLDDDDNYEIAFAIGCFHGLDCLYPALPVLERCLLSLLQRAEPSKPMRLSKLDSEDQHADAGGPGGHGVDRKKTRLYLQFFVNNKEKDSSSSPENQNDCLPVELEIMAELIGAQGKGSLVGNGRLANYRSVLE